jgi:hypothetical protein
MACMLESTIDGADRALCIERDGYLPKHFSSRAVLTASVRMQLPARERNAGGVTMGANRKFFYLMYVIINGGSYQAMLT